MKKDKWKKIFASVLSLLMLAGSVQPVVAEENGTSENQTGGDNTVSVQLTGGATKESDNAYVWNADTNSAGHRLTFRVNYIAGNKNPIASGQFQLRVPSTILTDRSGNQGDSYEMSLPTRDDVNSDKNVLDQNTYAYYQDGKDLVIYNCKDITAAENAYFEISYATTEATSMYADQSTAGFYATVKNPDGTSASSNTIRVTFNTGVKVQSTQVLQPTRSTTWKDEWGSKPGDADDYEYLEWPVRSYISSFTQPYTISLDDTVQGSLGGNVNTVGYKFAGQTGYSKDNSVSNQTNDQYRTDYVLTRYQKSKYNPSDATKVDRFTMDYQVTVTVQPIDEKDAETKATGSKTFVWQRPYFTAPEGRFYEWHHGDGTWGSDKRNCDDMTEQHSQGRDYERYDLDQFQKGTIKTLPDLRFITHSQSFLYPWTLGNDQDANNPADYGVNPARTEVSSDEVYLENFDKNQKLSNDYQFKSNPLTADDYKFDYISAYITNDIREYKPESESFASTGRTFDDNDVYHFLAKFGTDEWTEVGTYTPSTGAFAITDPNLVSAFGYDPNYSNNSRLRLKFADSVNATGWKISVSNAHYSTHIYVESFLNLNNSTTVMNYVNGKDSFNVSNVSKLECFDPSGNSLGTVRRWDFDRVTHMERESSLRKTAVSTSNNAKMKNYSITWRVIQDETTKSDTGGIDHVVQNGGTFYDLLPAGSTLNKKSVLVYANYGRNDAAIMPSSAYTIQTEDDYKKSGRTLLKISIKDPAGSYAVFYDSVHDWDSINDIGRNVLNPVAYETGNDFIADGYFDNPTKPEKKNQKNGLTGKTNQSLFTHLDTKGDKDPKQAKFIYAEDKHDITTLTAAAAGLSKKVKGSKDDSYSQNAYVGANDIYTYRLRFMNAYTNTAKRVVLYDSIENYKAGDWKGTPYRLDVSKIEELGIQPKIYISTNESVNIEDHHDLSDTSVWTLTTDLDNISGAKAIAIDLSEKADGTEYVLPAGKSVSAYLYMRAPQSVDTADNTHYPKTYNNVYVSDVLSATGSKEASYFIHQDYTTVNFKVTASFNLKKVSSQNENLPIPNITYRLKGTSDYGTVTDRKEKTDRNGSITFDDVEKGTYTLSEYESTEDWLLNTTEHQVVIGADSSVSIDGQPLNDTFIVRDDPRVHADVTFTKREMKDYHKGGKTISGVKFILTGMSDYGNQITKYATSDSDGSVTIRNVEKGTYTLKETETDKKYILPKDISWKVIVDGEANVSITCDQDAYVSRSNNGDITLYNEKYHSFKLVKWNNNKQLIKGVTFKLTGSSDYGTGVDTSETTDKDGVVTFEHLEAGNYFVQETEVPKGIVLDNTKHIVQIDQYDKIKIDDLTKNDEISKSNGIDAFNVIDLAVPTESVKITKKWKGNHDPDVIPELHVSETIPEDKIPYVTMANFRYWGYGVFENAYNGYDSFEKLPASIDPNTLDSNHVFDVTDQSKSIGRNYVKLYLDSQKKKIYWFSSAPITRLPESCDILFNEYYSLKKVDLTGLDASQVTNMSGMFSKDSNLQEVDFDGLDTSNVTDMSDMFDGCTKLSSLNLKPLNTAKVINMNGMFEGCSNLKQLDFSSLDTSNVKNMGYMFCDTNFESLDLKDLNTSNVTNMSGMFISVDMSHVKNFNNLDTSSVTNMYRMFNWAKNIPDLTNLNTAKVTNMSEMFQGCWNTEALNLSKFDTSNVTNMYQMFENDNKLLSLDLSSFDTSKVTDMRYMFNGCTSLLKIEVSSKWNVDNVNNSYMMFYGASKLTNYVWGNYKDSNYDKTKAYYGGDGKGYLTYKAFPATAGAKLNKTFKSIGNQSTAIGNNANDTELNSVNYLEDKPIVHDSNSKDIIRSDSTPDQIKSITEDANHDGYWDARNNDEWYYYFPVFTDNSKELYYWESKMDGFTTDYGDYQKIQNGGQTKNHEGEVTNTAEGYTEPVGPVRNENGSLKVTNNVSVMQWNNQKGGYDSFPYYGRQTFTFTISLKDKDGNNLQGRTVCGNTVFMNGNFTFYLANNESIEFTDIPLGYQYTVTENPPEGFDVLSYYGVPYNSSQTFPSGPNNPGVIGTDTTLNIRNWTYKQPGEPITNAPHFTLTKKVNTNGSTEDPNASYPFNVLLNNLIGGTTYSYKIGDKVTEFTADKSGMAVVPVIMKNNESADFGDLPVAATYQITETGGDYIPSYEIKDAGNSIIQSKEGTGKNQDLTTDVMNVSTDGADVTFTNTLDDHQDLKVTKKVNGDDGGRIYEITVDFTNLKPGTRIISDAGAFTEEDGSASKTLQLKKDESVVIHNIPVGTNYKVTETRNPAIASYEIKNGDNVLSNGHNDVAMKDLSTGSETVHKGENPEVIFTNTLNKADNSLNTLSVTNEVKGNLGDKNKYFRYTISLDGLEAYRPYEIAYTPSSVADEEDEKKPERLSADENGHAEGTFWLKNGETADITYLPKNASYTITEDPEKYQLDIRDVSNETTVVRKAKRFARKVSAAVSPDKNIAEGKMDGDKSYTFTNTRDTEVPTGVNENGHLWIMLIGLLGIAGYLVYRRKRHSLRS